MIISNLKFRALSFFLCTALLVFLTAGCGQNAEKSGEKAKNTLVVGDMWDFRSVDPAVEGIMIKEKAMLTECLIEANPDFTLKPGLASSWERVDDTTWKVHLREGVKFHDGSDLTADAVKWTIERTLKQDPSVNAVTKIKSIKVEDKTTLLFETEEPYVVFPASLEYPSLGIVSPSSKVDDNGNIINPVGTGPFKFEKWDEATGTLYTVRNDLYWGTAPKLDGVVIRGIPDPASRTMALEKGEVDIAWDVPYGDVGRLQTTAGLKVNVYAKPGGYAIQFGKLDGTPYNDIKVRQAISHAVDRAVISEKTLHGCAAPAAGPLAPDISWCNQSLTKHSYDPDKARALLAEAGWQDSDSDGILEKDGVKFSVTAYTWPQRPALPMLAEAVQSMLKNVGINAEVRVMDWSAISEKMTDKDIKIGLLGGMMIPDPDNALGRTYHSKGSSNTWGYANTEMDSLLEEGLKTDDQNKRRQIYDRVQELALAELPQIPVAYYKMPVVTRDYVKGYVYNPVAHDIKLNPEIFLEGKE
jgi:peptide/nickel transport system substrate-binding protein